MYFVQEGTHYYLHVWLQFIHVLPYQYVRMHISVCTYVLLVRNTYYVFYIMHTYVYT